MKLKIEYRNPVVVAMLRAGKKSVAHGKTKKAARRKFNQNILREVEA